MENHRSVKENIPEEIEKAAAALDLLLHTCVVFKKFLFWTYFSIYNRLH